MIFLNFIQARVFKALIVIVLFIFLWGEEIITSVSAFSIFNKLLCLEYKIKLYDKVFLHEYPLSLIQFFIEKSAIIDQSYSTNFFSQYGFWWILLVAFFGGIGLNFTPCLYPLLPITISYFGSRIKTDKITLITKVIAYWVGIVVMYSSIGVFSSLSGRILGEALTYPALSLLMAVIMLFLALAIFCSWDIKLPIWLNQWGGKSYHGLGGAFLMGLSLGIILAPCGGPFIIGIMTHIASTGQILYGLGIFFAFSIGLGLPIAILAFFSGLLPSLPKVGKWMIWIRHLLGIMLLAMVVHVAQPVIGDFLYRWGITLVIGLGSIYLGFIEKNGEHYFSFFKKIIGLAGVCLAIFFYWVTLPISFGHVAWIPFTFATLDKSIQLGRPIMIDFSASWCLPCRKLETETFSNYKVQSAMKDFISLKVEISNDSESESRTIMRKLQIRGVPTVVFLNCSGQVINELTLVGFEDSDNFLLRLRAAKLQAESFQKDR